MQSRETARFAAMMTKSADLKRRIAVELADTVISVVDACETSLRGGGKLLFCGNGGSAADSQHLATEMLIRLRGTHERQSIAALALTLDPAMLTACGNDYGYDRVFERPLRGIGRRGGNRFSRFVPGLGGRRLGVFVRQFGSVLLVRDRAFGPSGHIALGVRTIEAVEPPQLDRTSSSMELELQI